MEIARHDDIPWILLEGVILCGQILLEKGKQRKF